MIIEFNISIHTDMYVTENTKKNAENILRSICIQIWPESMKINLRS